MTKIMLVEDDKSLREIYSIRLVAEGYNIVSAGDGEEALDLAVQEKPDLIIADVMMPKISGFDMLDILRSTPETSKIKVIMMTALSSDEQRQRSEALGAQRHLVKSQVGIEDVVAAVHEVLGDKPNTDAQANINTLNATSTPTGKAAAAITPVTIGQDPATLPQDQTATPVQPQAPLPQPQAQQVAPTAPTATAAPMAPMPQQPAVQNGENPVNFKQAPVVMPTVSPSNIQSTSTAGAPQKLQAATLSLAQQQQLQQMYLQMLKSNSARAGVLPASQGPNNLVNTSERVSPQQPSAAMEDGGRRSTNGERVLQPINDPNLEKAREDMSKKMDEMLDSNAPVRVEINTNSAREAIKPKTETEKEFVASAERIATSVPVKTEEVVKPTGTIATANATPAPAPVATRPVAPVPAKSIEMPQSSPARPAVVVPPAVTMRQPMVQPAAQPAAAPKPMMSVQVPAAAKPVSPAPQLSPKLAAPTAVAAIPTMQKPMAPVAPINKPVIAPQLPPKPAAPMPQAPQKPTAPTPSENNAEASLQPTVAPITPGYVADLEEQLSQDTSSAEANNNPLAKQMIADLRNDAITIAAMRARAKQLENKPAAAPETEVELPSSLIDENLPASPNIAEGA